MADDFTQFDSKRFKETLGSFGTTTNPMGGNQLAQLQTAIRQGVKHVELHLSNAGKGQFGTSDVPDKYGFEQRRTIMQLAKLNEQTLSVHGTFNINTFSGLSQGGFNEVQRAGNIKEIDETLKFAAETAKSGAVVFHLHETGLPPTAPGELNLPEWYLKKLQKEKPDEYKNLMDKYFTRDELDRQFVDNPDLESELKVNFDNLSNIKRSELKENFDVSNWKEYFEYNRLEQMKLEQDGTPLVVVGNSLTKASRGQDVLNLQGLKDLTNSEITYLKSQGIETNYDDLSVDDFQKIQSKFSNGRPTDISKEDYKNLKRKLLLDYSDVLKDNLGMKSKADKEFFQKSMQMQIEVAKLQKKDFANLKTIFSEELIQIQDLNKKEANIAKQIQVAEKAQDKGKILELRKQLTGGELSLADQQEVADIQQKAQSGGQPSEDEITRYREIMKKSSGVTREKLELMSAVGQLEYQKLEKYDEYTSQFNEQIKKATQQKQNAKVLTDEIFEKNASAMGHLGLKALRYQLDLKKKADVSKEKLAGFNEKIAKAEIDLNNEADATKRSKLNNTVQKLKYDRRLVYGTSDYADIDVEKNPLYLAPENIMAGYGYMDSLEEYKGVIRTSWDEFATKLLSNESSYKQIKEDYEKETGKKIVTKADAIAVAKNHIGGTFDNAHAGVWMKYFKREDGESEEHRIDRFNIWLNNEAESMAKEGIIKHIHFNDTQGKDDDHNLLGSGVLDLFDFKEKMRGAGIKEALIVEAGGRGTGVMMHVLNAFDIFNPGLGSQIVEMQAANSHRPGYGISAGVSPSDWVTSVSNYENRPQFTNYGMNPQSFQGQARPQQGQKAGGWSGTGFL
ncbi:MAG: hypothetical protein HRU03_02265 [Nanoarchaeales archaeon]|nr:hypothetical protein [Nanoarchaeales archaeon]